MSICDSGIESNIIGGTFTIKVPNEHPLIQLSSTFPWKSMYNAVINDIKNSTTKGQWWRGRKLKIRTHLGVYILQQLKNLTDRETEALIKDNVAYQIFCGRTIVSNWKIPDHTKIESFRSRLSPDTQQKLANLTAKHAVGLGLADPSQVDIDSTVQEANMTYPTDAKMLRKLGSIAAKVAQGLKKSIPDAAKGVHVDLKKIASAARNYFFRKKYSSSEESSSLLLSLLDAVKEPVFQVISVCKKLKQTEIKKTPWNIKNAIHQLLSHSEEYFESVKTFITTGKAEANKRLSFHLNSVGCFNKKKPHKKYEFGRAFQIGRIAGNILFVTKNQSINMPDKKSLKPMLDEHKILFGKKSIDSLATDKGYYSNRNVRCAEKEGVSEIGIQAPSNAKPKKNELSEEKTEKLRSRRAGIEPLIGHLKQGGQMGRSRMKNDRNTESSGYASVFGFNLRQIIRKMADQTRKGSSAF